MTAVATLGPAVLAEESVFGNGLPGKLGCQEIFDGLQDFRHLTRERSLECLRSALQAGELGPEEVEPRVAAALAAASWEARQGGLQAAREAIEVWDRRDFRSLVLAEVPRLLVDEEYRVRKAVADVLRVCCKKDGLEVYQALSEVVLGDIRNKFQRVPKIGADDEPLPPTTYVPDNEGWRSLETSMCALEAMMQGCGPSFTPCISDEMLELLQECSRHTNRFVREYAFFALRDVCEVCTISAFLESIAKKVLVMLSAGVRDNWSQVRYAASVAVRAFMEKAGDEKERFYPELLGPMCLNRHYVAMGVRVYSQETWKQVCGPQGGARLLVAHLDSVIDCYDEAANAPNHAVREAGCHCISELAARVAGSPSCPTPHRPYFTGGRVQRLLQTLMAAFQDESWPVRDVASTAVGHFVRAFPEEAFSFRQQLMDLWFDQMTDNIPSLRKNGAAALALAVETWFEQLWAPAMKRLKEAMPGVQQQDENSQVFADYMPSGPFSVPRQREVPETAVTDQTMYSCGSTAPKTFRRQRRQPPSGCSDCDPNRPRQPWEATEGMVHLMAELATLAGKLQGPQGAGALDELAQELPELAKAFGYSNFRHHHHLKQRICERLPEMSRALEKRLLPLLPELLTTAVQCASQDAHPGLQGSARDVLACWGQLLSAEDAEAACKAANVDAKWLPLASAKS